MQTSRSLAIALASGLVLSLAACGGTPTPVTQVGLNRDTPEATYEYFKAMVRANQYAAEWSVLSPNAKRQANQLAGRNVDLGDYSTARQTIATNSQGDMAALLNSQLVGVTPAGANQATVMIGGMGRQASVRMAKLTSWELKVAGEPDPYGDFVRSAADAIAVNPDGSVTARIQAPGSTASILRTIPKDRIEGFAIKSQWYVDDLSGLQGAVSGMGSAPAQGTQPGRAPAPGTTQPRKAAPAAPPAEAEGSPG
jgi:hypothetical protein